MLFEATKNGNSQLYQSYACCYCHSDLFESRRKLKESCLHPPFMTQSQ